MLQNWHDLTFVHWIVDAERLQSVLPPGLDVDTFDGRAFLGFVPFTMSGIRLAGMPALPGVSAFHEWNIRTYVRGPHGPGVWFLSLEAANPLAVIAARTWFKLPYHYARMSHKSQLGSVVYTCLRRWPGPRAAQCVCETKVLTEPNEAEPGSLAFWLVERYLLYSCGKGRLYSGRVFHSPYKVATAKVGSLELDLLRAQGFLGLGDHISEVLFSPGVSVELWPLVKV